MKTGLMQYFGIAAIALGTNSAMAAGLDGLNFGVTSPAEWAYTATAEGWVDDLNPDQTITYGIVSDPTQANIVYFATSAPAKTPAGGDGVLLSIYRYNTSAQTYERLWRANFGSGDVGSLGSALPEWNVIGYDNGDVVYVQQRAGYVAPACSQSVLTGVDRIDGASLHALPGNFAESWDVGPTDYAPPQELIDQARNIKARCQ